MKTSFRIIILVFLSLETACSKNEPIISIGKEMKAELVYLKGDVRIESNGASVKGGIETPAAKGSTIITAGKSECNVLIGSDSYILIHENSVLTIENFSADTGKRETISLNLLSGKAVVCPKKMIEGETLIITTPAVEAEARGTKFVISCGKDTETKVAVIEGIVKMRPRIAALEPHPDSAIAAEIRGYTERHAAVLEKKQTGTLSHTAVKKLDSRISAIIKANPAIISTEKSAAQKRLNEKIFRTVSGAMEETKEIQILKTDGLPGSAEQEVNAHQILIQGDHTRRTLEYLPVMLCHARRDY